MVVLAGVLALASAVTPLSAQPAAGEKMASTGPANGGSGHQESLAITPVHQGDSIAAIVNDTPISELDVRQRMALFVSTSGVHPNAKQKREIRKQILKQLETERIQLLEAQKHDITVSSGQVDNAIANIIRDNHLTKAQLSEMLQQAGVYMQTLRHQILVQIAWSKTVQARYGSDITISPIAINAELRRLAASADKPRFRVGEIFMPVDTPEEAGKVKKDMDDLETQLSLGAPFRAVARQFSQNPTAAQGGEMGWVSPGQLLPELDKVLQSMKPGDVSHPIRAAGGFYILKLLAREEPEGTKLPVEQTKPEYPPGVLPLARVLLPVGPTPPPALMKQAMHAAEIVRANIRDCKMLPALVGKMHGAVYMNLGTMHLNQLSQQMQDALAKTEPGQTTQPFHSPAGVELIVRCDKAPAKIMTFKMPSRNQIAQKLYEERMAVLARRYMRDLRRDADIEAR